MKPAPPGKREEEQGRWYSWRQAPAEFASMAQNVYTLLSGTINSERRLFAIYAIHVGRIGIKRCISSNNPGVSDAGAGLSWQPLCWH
jgi:hypothetical protein